MRKARTDETADGTTDATAGFLIRTAALLLLTAGPPACGGGSAPATDDGDGSQDYNVADGSDASIADDADAVTSDSESDSESADTDAGLLPPADIHCGDGMVAFGEECDDGNRLNGDGCDWQCRWGDGEDPPDVPPDPDVGHAEQSLPASPLDLGVAHDRYASRSAPNRIPLTSDGSSYATVWAHPASSDTDAPMEGTFIRFDTSGRRLDAPWTYRLASSYYRGVMPIPRVDLAWTGLHYGLLWWGRDTWLPSEGPGMSFMLLDGDGKPLGAPLTLSTNGGIVQRLGLAWDGTDFGCLAESLAPDDGGDDMGFLRVAGDGELLDTTRSLLWEGVGTGSNALAASGELYVAAWTAYEVDGREARYGVRYGLATADGRPLGSTVLGPPANGSLAPPDVAWSGEEFGIVWVGPGPDAESGRIYLARLSATGTLLAPPTPVFATTVDADPVVTFGHGTYAIGWFGIGGAQLVRVDRNGTFVEHVVGPLGATIAAPATGMAADDAGFGMIFSEYDPSPGTSFGAPFFTWFHVTP
ncbi:MAG: hypothetical protein HY905_11375 [Deltaproteobacteria bacterium]|nr:hypothetical protein [Deltaproteobacteria bacterium]